MCVLQSKKWDDSSTIGSATIGSVKPRHAWRGVVTRVSPLMLQGVEHHERADASYIVFLAEMCMVEPME